MADKQQIIHISKVIYNNTLYEQVYNPDRNHSYYIGWDEKLNEPIPMEYIENGNIKYLPIHDDLLQKQAVLLPSEPIDYKNQEELEFEIDCFIETWLDVSKGHKEKAVWYILLSWVTENLHTIPYLRALGDYGCGKTRYLDVIGGLCYKPMFVGGAVRSAPIFRIIDLWRGTCVFDEFTLQQSDESQDIIQILNTGYQRGKPVLRCDLDYKVKAFDAFGAKIISTRQKFKDRALESRCITERMQLTDRTDIPIDLTKEFFEKRNELQNKLLMYRFKNWDKIEQTTSMNVDFGNILPRIQQSFAPFTVLFANDEERLKKFIASAQQFNNDMIEENAESFDGQLFNQYLNLLNNHNEEQETLDDYQEPVITSTDIKNGLVNDGWKEDKINTRTIGRHLKTLGFDAHPQKIAGKTIKKLEIDEKTLQRLKRRYKVTIVTKVTLVTDKADIQTDEVQNGS